MPGCVFDFQADQFPRFPFDSSYLKSARLTPRQRSARCAANVNSLDLMVNIRFNFSGQDMD